MKYFKENLTKEELRNKYRSLAKQYHPDVSDDPNANEIFQEIQNEYHSYIPSDGPMSESEFKIDDDFMKEFIEYLKKNKQDRLARLMEIANNFNIFGGFY